MISKALSLEVAGTEQCCPGDSAAKIKMLHVVSSFLRGGTELLMLGMLSRLVREGFDITACCIGNTQLPEVTRSFQEADIKTMSFPQGPGPALVYALARFTRREQFQVVHTHHYYANLYGRLAAILARTPVIMTYQHNWPGQEKGRHRLAFRSLNPWTYRYVTVSEAIRRYDIEGVGIAPGKVVCAYNGIDTARFRPPSFNERREAKELLALPPDCTTVGMVGRLVNWKRFDLALRAAASVARSGRDVYFLLVGDGPERSSLEDLARAMDIGRHVHFLGWRSDMARLYQAMDIFCQTSHSGGVSLSNEGGEGFGLVTVEAMATALPVVAVDTDVNREVVTGTCGLFCQPTPDDIAAKLSELIEKVDLRRSLGQAARSRATDSFDIQRPVRELASIYRQAVRDRVNY